MPVRVFTARGKVYPAVLTLRGEPKAPIVLVDGAGYGPGDSIEGDRIIGAKASEGTDHDLVAAFNIEARRTE